MTAQGLEDGYATAAHRRIDRVRALNGAMVLILIVLFLTVLGFWLKGIKSSALWPH